MSAIRLGALVEPRPSELSDDDQIIAVWGESWDGTPVMRAVRVGRETVLRGEHGKGFDVQGPLASLCGECGELMVSESSGHHTMTVQRHYGASHPLVYVGMLPR